MGVEEQPALSLLRRFICLTISKMMKARMMKLSPIVRKLPQASTGTPAFLTAGFAPGECPGTRRAPSRGEIIRSLPEAQFDAGSSELILRFSDFRRT